MNTTPETTLGTTALEVWRVWRALPWQGLPCYGQALGVGEFCWQPSQKAVAGFELHRYLNEFSTTPASEVEQDLVWECLLSGALRIYTRRNRMGGSRTPVHVLHEMTGLPFPSGLMQ